MANREAAALCANVWWKGPTEANRRVKLQREENSQGLYQNTEEVFILFATAVNF